MELTIDLRDVLAWLKNQNPDLVQNSIAELEAFLNEPGQSPIKTVQPCKRLSDALEVDGYPALQPADKDHVIDVWPPKDA